MSAPGVGGVVVGVTTPGDVVVLGTAVAGGAVVAADPADVPVLVPCAPAATAESIVQAMAKHAMAKNAPACR